MKLDFYRSDEQATRRSHLRSLDYARFEAGIYSWWGQDSKEDGRFSGMLRETNATGTPVRWALVTTFNEWGENTTTESATEWASPSGKGQYLDAPAGL